MNKLRTIILFIILGIALASCQGKKTPQKPERFGDNTYYDPSLRFIEDNQKDGKFYRGDREQIDFVEELSNYVKFEKDKTKLKNADAVEYIDGKIYVVDSVSHEVAVLDLEGNRLKTIGKEGKAEAEFKTPIDIFYHAGHAEYYILDAGNERVQVFDLKDKFIRQISLKATELNKTASYQSVSVDDDKNIYIAPIMSPLKTQRLCRINEKGELFRYDKVISGSTIMADGKIYYFDTLEVFVARDPSTSPMIKESNSKNSVYKITEDKMEYAFKFPDLYAPASVIIEGDKVYAFSSSYLRLDVFNLKNGKLEYQHSISKQLRSPNIMSPFSQDLSSTGSHLILAEKEDANIYLFDLGQEE